MEIIERSNIMMLITSGSLRVKSHYEKLMRLSKSKLCTHNLHTDINTGLIEKTGFSGKAKEGALHN